MDKCILRAMFDEMWDRFQNSGETGLEDIHVDIMKHWHDFLSAGLDANKVAEMMPPMEVFTHYDVLTSYGAEIDATELAFSLEDGFFVEEHLADFANRGADINRIAKEWFSVDEDDDIERLLEAGVDAKVVFEMSNDYLISEMDFSRLKDLVNVLGLFSDNGVSLEDIKEWVLKNRDFDVNYSIVWEEEDWESIGIEANDEIIKSFLTNESPKSFIDDNIPAIFEDGLPKTITPEKLLEFISIDRLIYYLLDYGLDGYFMIIGGDAESLAKKFLKEKGYRPERDCIHIMFELLLEDSTVIDLAKFIDCCKKCDELTDEDRHKYYEYLSDIEGIDKDVLAKLL